VLLTVILCAVVGYVVLVLPLAVVIGRALREPLDEYATSEPALAYPAAARPTVTLAS